MHYKILFFFARISPKLNIFDPPPLMITKFNKSKIIFLLSINWLMDSIYITFWFFFFAVVSEICTLSSSLSAIMWVNDDREKREKKKVSKSSISQHLIDMSSCDNDNTEETPWFQSQNNFSLTLNLYLVDNRIYASSNSQYLHLILFYFLSISTHLLC